MSRFTACLHVRGTGRGAAVACEQTNGRRRIVPTAHASPQRTRIRAGVEFGYQGGLSAFYTLGPASALPGHEAADMLCTRGSFDLTPAHVLKLEWRADGGSILKHNFAVRLVGGADPDDEFQVTTVTSVGPRSEEAFSTPWRTAAVAMPLAHAARICLVWTLPARGEASGAYFYFDNVRLTCASAAAAGDDGGPEDEEE